MVIIVFSKFFVRMNFRGQTVLESHISHGISESGVCLIIYRAYIYRVYIFIPAFVRYTELGSIYTVWHHLVNLDLFLSSGLPVLHTI